MHTLDKAEVFSDVFARRGNFVTGIEARTKLVFVLLALVINLTAASIYTSISIAAICLITLLAIRIPAKILLLRLAMPLVMAAVVLLTQLVFYGETPLFAFSLWGLRVTGYEEGLTRGLLIMCRVLGGVSLILLLSMSTPADKLFTAASWFKIPGTIIEIALLIYRYVFVLIEEISIMKDAQRVRLGYHNWRQSMKSVSTLGACLILRAYDRAERVFEAMSVRGYTGASSIHYPVFARRDGLTALCLGFVLVGFYLIGRMGA